MAYGGKKQGVISGSLMWNNKEYVEIFDQNFKYLWGELDDPFIVHGSWVEYDVVDSPREHPRNCLKMAININMDVKMSNAPTTDEFGKVLMNVRVFNKVDYFQYDFQNDGILTHKTTIHRNRVTDWYYNEYYGEVTMARDARNRLIQFHINQVDVMMNLIPSTRYSVGPHWEVTHFVNEGTPYSINGFLSIRGHILRGAGGVVRNRADVHIPPDALRPVSTRKQQSGSPSWGAPVRNSFPETAPLAEQAPVAAVSEGNDREVSNSQDPLLVAQQPPRGGLAPFGRALRFPAAAYTDPEPLCRPITPPPRPESEEVESEDEEDEQTKKTRLAELRQEVGFVPRRMPGIPEVPHVDDDAGINVTPEENDARMTDLPRSTEVLETPRSAETAETSVVHEKSDQKKAERTRSFGKPPEMSPEVVESAVNPGTSSKSGVPSTSDTEKKEIPRSFGSNPVAAVASEANVAKAVEKSSEAKKLPRSFGTNPQKLSDDLEPFLLFDVSAAPSKPDVSSKIVIKNKEIPRSFGGCLGKPPIVVESEANQVKKEASEAKMSVELPRSFGAKSGAQVVAVASEVKNLNPENTPRDVEKPSEVKNQENMPPLTLGTNTETEPTVVPSEVKNAKVVEKPIEKSPDAKIAALPRQLGAEIARKPAVKSFGGPRQSESIMSVGTTGNHEQLPSVSEPIKSEPPRQLQPESKSGNQTTEKDPKITLISVKSFSGPPLEPPRVESRLSIPTLGVSQGSSEQGTPSRASVPHSSEASPISESAQLDRKARLAALPRSFGNEFAKRRAGNESRSSVSQASVRPLVEEPRPSEPIIASNTEIIEEAEEFSESFSTANTTPIQPSPVPEPSRWETLQPIRTDGFELNNPSPPRVQNNNQNSPQSTLLAGFNFEILERPRNLGFIPVTTRPHGISFGSFGPPSPLPQEEEYDDSTSEMMEYTLNSVAPSNVTVDDEWGDSISMRQRFPPRPITRSGLPPQVKTRSPRNDDSHR